MGFSDSIKGLSSSVGDFSPDSLFSILDHPALAKVSFFLKMGFWFMIFVFGCIFIYKTIIQYKIKITLLQRVGGGGVEVKTDRAKIVVDDQNKRKLQLFKLRKGKHPITLPVPDSYYKSKIKKSDHYFLWIDDNFQVHPIEKLKGKKSKLGLKEFTAKLFSKGEKPIDCSKSISPVKSPVLKEQDAHYLAIRPEERDAWARMEDKIILERYKKKDKLEKFLPAGILLMSMIIAFLIFFFGFKELGAALNNLAQQFAQVAASCTTL